MPGEPRKKGPRGATPRKPSASAAPASARQKRPATKAPKLLSGGNPQIAKGDGEAPVRAYIAAMPGWKREVGEGLDALVERLVPGVKKAVRWNTPFYGVEGQGWFLAYHCITRYVKVTFFAGASLRPPPPVESKQKGVRYLHIFEADRAEVLAGDQLAAWIRAASRLPGERCFETS